METKRSNNYTPRAKNDADLGGRVPPRDLDVEQAVLGALMLEKDAYSVVCDLLKPESFYDPVNSMVYAAIQQLGAAQKPIDMLTVTEQLRLDGNLEKIGGPVVVSELTSRVLSGANVEYHARIVAQKYLARELISFSSDISTKAFDEVHDVDDLLQEAEGRLFEISQRNVKKDVTQINPVIEQAIKQIQAAANRASGLSGLESGFHELDKLTSGWQSSDLIIIAARPAMGKTAFVLSMAKNMAVNYEIPVAIFSLEMSNVQLVNRLISNVCELGGEKIKSGQLSPMEWDQLMSRVKELQDARLYIEGRCAETCVDNHRDAALLDYDFEEVACHQSFVGAYRRGEWHNRGSSGFFKTFAQHGVGLDVRQHDKSHSGQFLCGPQCFHGVG